MTAGFTLPTSVTTPPGDTERLFVTEKDSALIRVVRDGAILPAPFLDLDAVVDSNAFGGLYSLTFHPQYAANGLFYVYYSDLGGATVLERYSVSAADPNLADSASGLVILTVPHPVIGHSGGGLAFGPDGFLYLTLGDGNHTTLTCDSQDPSLLLGKLIRIDVDGGSPYVIPPSNPFVGVPGYREEIWALGLRNPWRMSFDRATGDLFIGDNGKSLVEEIDFEPAGFAGGNNYGWAVKEGSQCFAASPCSGLPACTDAVWVDPVHEYDHSLGCSVIGGYVYRGCAIPDLQGSYFYGDHCADGSTNGIWSFRYDGQNVSDLTDRTTELDPPGGLDIASVVSFGEDGYGEIYILDFNDGELFKIVPAVPFEDCNANGVPDTCEPDADGDGVIDDCEVGSAYCSPATPNSTGLPGVLDAAGSEVVVDNDLTGHAVQLPPGEYAILLVSDRRGGSARPGALGGGVSRTGMCVGAAFGAFHVTAGTVDGAGEIFFPIDLAAIPTWQGPVGVLPGETWFFQTAYRDGGPFLFTNGLSITFQ